MLWVGTNNYENTAEQVAGGVLAIAELLISRLPKAKVVVLVSGAVFFWKRIAFTKDNNVETESYNYEIISHNYEILSCSITVLLRQRLACCMQTKRKKHRICRPFL